MVFPKAPSTPKIIFCSCIGNCGIFRIPVNVHMNFPLAEPTTIILLVGQKHPYVMAISFNTIQNNIVFAQWNRILSAPLCMKIQRIFCYLFKRVINGIEEGRLWLGGFIGDGDARMTAEGHGKKTIESTVGITVDRLCINQLLCIPRIAEKIADRAFYRGRFFSVPIDTQDDVAKEFT